MGAVRKFSRKREAILQCVRGTTCHPAAEWVYARLKPEIPDLSLGTVYRNLAMFKQEGDIISVGTVGGLERFDGNTTPHAHFICTRCCGVYDVPQEPLPEPFLASAAQATGGEIRSYQLSYYGVCENCKSSPPDCEENQKTIPQTNDE